MRIFFLGDIVGKSGCYAVTNNLPNIIKEKKIDFVIVNGENAANQGVGITEKITIDLFNSGVNVITTGNHVWDQKEALTLIEKEKKLLRPENLFNPSPGKGFGIYNLKNGMKIGVLNLMGNVFMKKCEDVFLCASKFLEKNNLKKDYDFLVVDFHGEITSEKMAIGHFFDGKATLVVGTHTHVPTNDARILNSGTAYMTDAGMCGDYNSVIGMDKNNSINRFMKKDSIKHFPAEGEASLCGVIVDAIENNGLANKIENFIIGGYLKNTI
tara:strand:+ start:446 stop:1252 length:807 start_codon:yes stop_codon:yes gene_type:complete